MTPSTRLAVSATLALAVSACAQERPIPPAPEAGQASTELSAANMLTPTRKAMPVATYSIVARDPITGDLGVAVQSHWFSVGALVPWAEAGVGAVATQSFVDPAYGQLGLAMMAAGHIPSAALSGLVAADEGRAVRQVAMVSADGAVAAHTGKNCIEAAGHQTGAGYSVQANLMENETVWPAMAKAFENTKGDLAARMLAALKAAEEQGGDIRGKQSAALLVVSGEPTGRPWEDRLFDLRVEDHPEPLQELDRLLTTARAYSLMNDGDLAMEAKDMAGALRAYSRAEAMAPTLYELPFWVGVTLAAEGRIDEALPKLARAYKGEERLRELIPRLAVAGLLPADEALLAKLAEAR